MSLSTDQFLELRPGELTNGQRFRDEDSVRQIHRWEHHLEAARDLNPLAGV